MEREELCREQQDRLLVSDDKKDFDEALRLARMLGGKMAIADSQEAAERISQALEPVKVMCNYVFIGFTDRKNESEWVNIYTQEKLTWKNWFAGQPNNGGNQDCGGMVTKSKKLFDTNCFNKMCSIIQIKQSPKFHLRGVCDESTVDVFYTFLVPSGNETILEKELLGFKQTKMIWSTKQKRWNIVSLIDGNILAHTNSTDSQLQTSNFPSFPFGSHQWFFTDSTCSDPGQPWRTLNMHQKVEQPGQFCCDDGLCIDSELRCDGNNHCLDRSDEKMCQTLQVPQTYNLEVPPLKEERSGVEIVFHQLEIATFVRIQNILNINEQTSMILLKFGVFLEWLDYRLKFNFLKTDAKKNTLKDGGNTIWTPKLTVLIKSDQTKSAVVQQQITINRQGNALLEGKMGHLHPNESYAGSENPLSLAIRYQGEFYCDFTDIVNYPFDTE